MKPIERKGWILLVGLALALVLLCVGCTSTNVYRLTYKATGKIEKNIAAYGQSKYQQVNRNDDADLSRAVEGCRESMKADPSKENIDKEVDAIIASNAKRQRDRGVEDSEFANFQGYIEWLGEIRASFGQLYQRQSALEAMFTGKAPEALEDAPGGPATPYAPAR